MRSCIRQGSQKSRTGLGGQTGLRDRSGNVMRKDRLLKSAERWRTVGSEINRAVRDTASLVVGDAHGQVVAVDKGDW